MQAGAAQSSALVSCRLCSAGGSPWGQRQGACGEGPGAGGSSAGTCSPPHWPSRVGGPVTPLLPLPGRIKPQGDRLRNTDKHSLY